MRSLFIRILLVLLGSFLAVILLSFILFYWSNQDTHPGEHRLQQMAKETATEVVIASLEGRLDGLRRRLHHRHHTRTWLLDQHGKLLTPPPVPSEILSQVDAYPSAIYPFQNTAGRFFIFAQAPEHNGIKYRVILATDRLPRFTGGKSRLVVMSVIGLFTVLFASAWLSYWILRPLQTLRNTTRRISADSLAARLPASLTNRSDAFGELGKEFNRMTDRVERSVESQKQLLRDVSHELRSPLARIQVAASLFQKKHGDQSELHRIEDEVARLDDLIESLLSLSRLQDIGNVSNSKIELNPLLQNVVEDCNFEFQQSGCRAELNGPLNTFLFGDADLMTSMFENIIRNALRFSPEKGIVKVHYVVQHDWIDINISDSGPGVATDKLDRIFDAFYRGDEARDISKGEHGIGLAIARTVALLHSGSIHASNNREGGLTVTIQLPTTSSDQRL